MNILGIKPKDAIRRRFILAESDGLVIETIQIGSKTGRQRLRALKLKGVWYANDYNELCFEATGRKGPPETFTFKGSWTINNNQQIEYISKDGRDTLTFKGYWLLPSADPPGLFLRGQHNFTF